MLTMVCGVPNAGKTTYSQKFKNVLHLDEIGAVDNVVNKLKQVDGDIIVEGYFGSRLGRCKIVKAYEGYTKCIFLSISVDESIRRENRGRNEHILRNASRFFEHPTYKEGWDEILIIKTNETGEQEYELCKTQLD